MNEKKNSCKKIWCNTDKINEQNKKKKYRIKLHKHM